MKRILRILAALGILVGPAYAADVNAQTLPTKAAPLGYPAVTGSGFYFGLGAEAEVANSSVASSTFGSSLYSAGASIEMVTGYQFKFRGDWVALEAGATYTNLGNTATCAPGVSCGVGSTWGFNQGVLVGFPWTYVFSYLPNLTAIFGTSPAVPLPAGVAPTSGAPYVSLMVHEKDVSASIAGNAGSAWQVSPAIGLGTINFLPNGLVLDTRLEYSFANSSFSFGPNAASVANKGSSMMAHAIFKF